MKPMDLNKPTSERKEFPWSDDALQALVTLNLWLSAQAGCLEATGVVGNKGIAAVYNSLSERMDYYIQHGPKAMKDDMDTAVAKAHTLNQLKHGVLHSQRSAPTRNR